MSNQQFTAAERLRYGRQLALPQFGEEGQRRLRESRVAIVGAGGLGSPAAMYLAAAGVGQLTVLDFDVVDASNLHRQLLYGSGDVGKRKVDVTKRRLNDINPNVEVTAIDARLNAHNALELLRGHDVIVDGTDNFPTRYLVNDASILLGVTNVYGSVFRFEGQVSVLGTSSGPCYRCLVPVPPPPGSVPSCAEGGVLGVLPGIVGSLQALEAIKLIARVGEPLIGRLLMIDTLQITTREIAIDRDPQCPACGTRELQALIDYDTFCGVAPQPERFELSPAELEQMLRRNARMHIVDVRSHAEWAEDHLGAAVHVPLDEIEQQHHRWQSDDLLVLVCRSGVRSAQAANTLEEAGFTNVRSLTGGMLRFRGEGRAE